jgi:hypothetical protein
MLEVPTGIVLDLSRVELLACPPKTIGGSEGTDNADNAVVRVLKLRGCQISEFSPPPSGGRGGPTGANVPDDDEALVAPSCLCIGFSI